MAAKSQVKVVDKINENRNNLSFVLVGLLVVSSFVIGSLYQKVKYLEGDKTAAVQGVNNNNNQQQQVEPTEVAKADLTVNDDDPSLGPENAKVTVIEFSDFLCPYCAAYRGNNEQMVSSMQERIPNWEPAFPGLRKEYIDSGKIRFVWKDYPLHGEEAILVHSAAKCAQEQNKFWEFHDVIFDNYGKEGLTYNKEFLNEVASEVKLNAANFTSCLESGKYTQKMQDAISYAQSVGANGTPATFINGKLISGADTYSSFKKEIDAILK
ncbi:MAG: oxidoreductase [Candidatus Gottesmanbacteria bacterium GW2011_GWA2_43_14]|uniref:Oxidoreductase n=1 Tax=Candidatus Gottesmanbacteria bacterium GW2011_GWA2_43_14 TaxID=1618443 RepID=A0A0G1DK30_9BACT|nr:MAG: oxidoreductase [Candidatus Gottesmanbacteria bacterium GW2011_GWA2_43_14]